MKKNPLVSVCIPVFMAERTLPRLLESLLLQSFDNFEVVIVDDGSEEMFRCAQQDKGCAELGSCKKIVKEFSKKAKKLRKSISFSLVVHSKNLGLVEARHSLGLNAKAPYIVFADSDNTVKINSYNCFYESDGYYYVECDENPFDPEFTYSDASDVQYEVDGAKRYFKLEPIKWRAVSNDYDFDGSTGSSTATLFLCETILTASVPYYVSQNSRTLGSATIHANNYKYSNIRAFLNGTKNRYVIEGGNSSSDVDWSGKGFLQLAFGSSAQEKIKSTVVDNSALSTGDFAGSISTASEYACADTEDKVFILSEYEVTNTSYGFSAYDAKGIGNSRIRKVCDYAIANYADLKNETGFGGYWLLRSPYSTGENVLSIESDGETYVSVETDNLACGIVPAICVSLN